MIVRIQGRRLQGAPVPVVSLLRLRLEQMRRLLSLVRLLSLRMLILHCAVVLMWVLHRTGMLLLLLHGAGQLRLMLHRARLQVVVVLVELIVLLHGQQPRVRRVLLIQRQLLLLQLLLLQLLLLQLLLLKLLLLQLLLLQLRIVVTMVVLHFSVLLHLVLLVMIVSLALSVGRTIGSHQQSGAPSCGSIR